MRKAMGVRTRYFTAPIGAVLAMGTVFAAWSSARADEKGPASMKASEQHKYTNALIHSTSPYLLQHAHNPVNWNPWGPEALSKARSEDKPIFLSIGYAACHWCHVMERESFENEEIARVLNEHFVAIKVDREERPDLDEIYMAATVIYNQGQGGWPMSVFLTPDLKPFFAGTYFPPTSRYGRPGFRELLEQIATLWKSDREKISGNADGLTQAVREYTAVVQGSATIKPETISKAVETLGGFFDTQYGGMGGGGTNKFPPSMAMALMLREYRHSVSRGNPKENSLRLVRLTLDQMARGGIYDHLGGGIARYSTDVRWLVPHFEKMLYDQALVSDIYIEAHQVTGDPFYASVASGIFDYVIDDLQSSEGGFYSTRDADSEGEEGKYYVWTLGEVEGLLGGDDAKLFGSYYDVTESGNWEGKNILNVSRPPEAVAKLNGMSVKELEGRLGPMREKLLAARARREPPGLDDKILTSWNGLMISSLAKGGRVLGRDRYVGAARRAADFVLKDLRRDGRLLRSYRKGKAHIPGFLSDYAFFIEGLLNLYEATFEVKWLKAARELNEILVEHYYDAENGGFFYAADDAERILVRTKDTGGSAVPSGNSVQYQNMLRLALLFDREDWREKNERTLAAFGARIAERPFSNERFLSSIDFQMSGVREIALVGAARDEATRKLIRTAFERFLPNKVVVLLDPDSPDADWLREHVPLVRGKTAKEGRASAYVCRNYTCRAPVHTPEALAAQLR